jgi:N-acetylglutamate synthase
VLHITRRGGQSVRLAEPALVAGKVVPDAPARRRGVPAAGVRESTEVAARGWPAVETERLGNWTLRASAPEPPVERGGEVEDVGDVGESVHEGAHGDVRGDARGGALGGVREGFTARANSVLPLGDPGLPLPEALERARDWYRARGVVPRVQVTTGGERTDELLAAELERLGWRGERYALLRVAALAPLADREPDRRVLLGREPGAGWFSLYRRAGRLPEVARKVLTGGPSVWFATVPARQGAAAIGRCVVDGRWAGFAAIEVAPEHRRQGLATAVMAELARKALDEGASAAYLQVERDNEAARALYDGMGFADHHAYHYRTAPEA